MTKALKIQNFPDYYITENGDVFSRKNNGRIRKLKPGKTSRGYLSVALRKNNKSVHKTVHSLVAETFIPNPENKKEINHKNGIKTDNRVENLEWITHKENVLHAYRILKRKSNMCAKFGKQHPRSKIIQQLKNEEVIAEFYGACEAFRKTGVCYVSIYNCCNSKIKSAGGYQWKYK